MNGMTYEDLTRKHPVFVYEGYRMQSREDAVTLTYSYTIEGLDSFETSWTFPKTAGMSLRDAWQLDRLAFGLGMAELISYWKITCSPRVEIRPKTFHSPQASWWKKLMRGGLGEFFYRNGIEAGEDFVSFAGVGGEPMEAEARPFHKAPSGLLIPIGGGKDSIVTLELTKGSAERNGCYLINPKASSLEAARLAGYRDDQIIRAHRKLDPKILRYNQLGYLNGHIPFSAVVAFSAAFAAVLSGKEAVALSNESSANESTVQGSDVNHQYSKSYEFEEDFSRYLSDYVSEELRYFSLLRPLCELQIAGLFSRYEAYHPVFRSCNLGSKQDAWCCDCPKCLFVYLILSPFLSQADLQRIFGENLLNKASMGESMEQLVGIQSTKPFECVGSREEACVAACLAIDRVRGEGEAMPLLLERYLQSGLYEKYRTQGRELLGGFDPRHQLPEELEALLRRSLAEMEASWETSK